MKSKVVAILETRTGAHLAEMIARRGGVPLRAPALEEVPDVDPAALHALLRDWRVKPYGVCIFQTGVGTRALFCATDAAGLTPELEALLAAATIVVRGPKPLGELTARKIRVDIRAASPFTTETVLSALESVALDEVAVLVQRYGAPNPALTDGLRARGASVTEIVTYRWALPADTQPLRRLIAALAAGNVDAVLFTSAVQMQNLARVAQECGDGAALAAHLNRVLIASIGPACSRALRAHGVEPAIEAEPPKLGPLLAALEQALATHGNVGASPTPARRHV